MEQDSHHKRHTATPGIIGLVCMFVFLALVCLVPTKAYAAVPVDSSTFPDPVLLSFVEENYDSDSDGILSDAEIAAVTEFNIVYYNINSLEGIQVFTSCEVVNIRLAPVEVADLSNMPSLKYLYAERIWAKTIDVSGCVNLIEMYCEESLRLTSLDLTGCTSLEILYAYTNPFSELDVSTNTALKRLEVSETYLTELDVSNNVALESLNCDDMRAEGAFSFPDLSKNVNLRYLYASGNRYPNEINLTYSHNLKTLSLSQCELKAIDISVNEKLESLVVIDNEFTSIDLSHNPELLRCFVDGNQLSSIDISKNLKLETLSCANNNIKQFDLTNNSALKSLGIMSNGTTSIEFGYHPAFDNIACGDNELTSLDLRGAENLVMISLKDSPLLKEVLLSRTAKVQTIDAQNCSFLNFTIPDADSINFDYLLYFEGQTRTIEFVSDGAGGLISTESYDLLAPTFAFPDTSYDPATGYIHTKQIGSCGFTAVVDTTFIPTPHLSGALEFTFKGTTHTVTFLDHEGKVLSSVQVPPGLAAFAPTVSEIPGKEFTGWDKDFSEIYADTTVRALYRDLSPQDNGNNKPPANGQDSGTSTGGQLPGAGDDRYVYAVILFCIGLAGVASMAAARYRCRRQ